MSDYPNIKRLLKIDKNSPDVVVDPLIQSVPIEAFGDARFPAYQDMLESAKDNAIDSRLPQYKKDKLIRINNPIRKNDLTKTFGPQDYINRSEPNSLHNILYKNSSPEFKQLMYDRAEFKSDPRVLIDRTDINEQIIKAYLKDVRPDLYQNIVENYPHTPEEIVENKKTLINEAAKFIPNNNAPKLKQEKPLPKNYGEYYKHDNSIMLSDDAPVNVPFHETLHSNRKFGGEELAPDFKNSNTLGKSIPTAQNEHIVNSNKLLASPKELPFTFSEMSPGESGEYFNLLRKLIGKPIKEK